MGDTGGAAYIVRGGLHCRAFQPATSCLRRQHGPFCGLRTMCRMWWFKKKASWEEIGVRSHAHGRARRRAAG